VAKRQQWKKKRPSLITDLTTNTPYALGKTWGVPTLAMVPLSEDLKAEVAGILTGQDRAKKGILTLPGQGLGPERMIQDSVEHRGLMSSSAMASKEGEKKGAEMHEQIETRARIAIACENETRAVPNMHTVGGKADRQTRPRVYIACSATPEPQLL
jgi:hypothetical protein